MKVEVTLSKQEADRLLGRLIASEIAGPRGSYRCESVEWTTYASRVHVVLTDEPDEPTQGVVP